ncbi:MAG: hypothetical protein PHV34_22995 [Verrucomicrobiae bacterium]|nr:hypothetical protein [Verrucomicrobiae bacterium]
MIRKPSRLSLEAREAKSRAAELEKKIQRLSDEIVHPQKYMAARSDGRSQSAVDRFRRYFRLNEASAAELRKPTRAELRAHRNRAILLTVVAFIVLIWVMGKLVYSLR